MTAIWYLHKLKVLVNIDIPRRSYMMNITLSALQTMASEKNLNISNPREFSSAFIVIQFEKNSYGFLKIMILCEQRFYTIKGNNYGTICNWVKQNIGKYTKGNDGSKRSYISRYGQFYEVSGK